MSQDIYKKAAAAAAIKFIEPGQIIGVGTGSTVKYFIDALADMKHDIEGAVSSSNQSTEQLKSLGIPILDLNSAGTLSVYIDGADEINERLEMIKGGGAALTREKIIAGASEQMICIADTSKLVNQLGKFPLPIEVIPMARSFVARQLVGLGGDPVYREGVVTDNGNHIIDIFGLDIQVAAKLEETINNIPGVVTNGLFALRPADIALIASSAGVQTFRR